MGRAVPALHALVLLDHERARTDETHLAFENVEQLGQLVQRALASNTDEAASEVSSILGGASEKLTGNYDIYPWGSVGSGGSP